LFIPALPLFSRKFGGQRNGVERKFRGGFGLWFRNNGLWACFDFGQNRSLCRIHGWATSWAAWLNLDWLGYCLGLDLARSASAFGFGHNKDLVEWIIKKFKFLNNLGKVIRSRIPRIGSS
jgi:hypothetical protein